jgi:hypothetical protein
VKSKLKVAFQGRNVVSRLMILLGEIARPKEMTVILEIDGLLRLQVVALKVYKVGKDSGV